MTLTNHKKAIFDKYDLKAIIIIALITLPLSNMIYGRFEASSMFGSLWLTLILIVILTIIDSYIEPTKGVKYGFRRK